MSNSTHPIEWFLGRDGKQHGPISDLEMRKLVELGHLRPTDLVWRQGMPNWSPAPVIIAELTPRPVPAAPPIPQAQPPLTRARAPEGEVRPTAPTPEPRGPRDAATAQASPRAASAPGGSPEASGSAPGPRPPQHGSPASGYPAAPGLQAHTSDPRSGGVNHSAIAAPHPGEAGPRRAPPPPVVNRSQMSSPPSAAAAGQQGSAAGEQLRQPAPRVAMPPPPSTPRRRETSGEPKGQSRGASEYEASPKERSRFPIKIAIALVIMSALGGASVALYRSGYLANLSMLTGQDTGVPVVRAPKAAMKESPLKSFADTPQEVDAGFQKAPLWQLIKREFPDWYNERVAETVKLREEKKDDKAIAAHLTGTLVDLRRKNAASALAASPERLKFVAAAFIENLVALQKQSVDACYGFISQGESSPAVVELLRSAEHSAPLQTQFTAIFEAVIDGRRAPRTNQQPKREDYDVLAQQLAKKGWSPTDLQVFSDAAALARAQPARVCQMVQDWFSAQLAVSDEATQLRLLVEALKPVVAG